ncbi:MAG: hypothetical protein ACYC0H_02485 [Solirubrobacteraceae bacterium]
MSTSSASSAAPGVYSSDALSQIAGAPGPVRMNGSEAHASEPTPDEQSGQHVGHRDAPELEVEQDGSAAPADGRLATVPANVDVAATSSVSAEAQQGDGPAAAGASASGVGRGTARTSVVSVVIGPEGAAAACEAGAVVAGPHGAAAASQAGVAAVGQNGAASSSNAANATSAAVNGAGKDAPYAELLERLAQLENESRKLRLELQ